MKCALLIGINYARTTHALDGCIDDVVNMRHVLVRHFGYAAEDVVTLRDDASDFDHLPTRRNILIALRQLMKVTPECQEITIHYSGHGTTAPSPHGAVSETPGQGVTKAGACGFGNVKKNRADLIGF
jgi:hypothetical protein